MTYCQAGYHITRKQAACHTIKGDMRSTAMCIQQKWLELVQNVSKLHMTCYDLSLLKSSQMQWRSYTQTQCMCMEDQSSPAVSE